MSDTSATRWKAHLHPSIPAIVLLPRFVAKKPPMSPPAIVTNCTFADTRCMQQATGLSVQNLAQVRRQNPCLVSP